MPRTNRCAGSALCGWCPRSVRVLQATCILVIFGLCILMIYGRSMPAVCFAITGIVFSLEAFYAAGRRDLCMLKTYFCYLLVQSGVSVGYGIYSLTNVDESCAGMPNTSTCVSASIMLSLMLVLGSTSIGVVAAVNTFFVLMTGSGSGERQDADERDAAKIAL